MNFKRLNSDLEDLIELRNQIHGMDFNDEAYDDLEDEILSFEDTFNNKYGADLEKILKKIHKSICPTIPNLLPTAYVASNYVQNANDAWEAGKNGGITVETIFENDNGKTISVRLLLFPNPFRIEMHYGKTKKVAWSPDDPENLNIQF